MSVMSLPLASSTRGKYSLLIKWVQKMRPEDSPAFGLSEAKHTPFIRNKFGLAEANPDRPQLGRSGSAYSNEYPSGCKKR